MATGFDYLDPNFLRDLPSGGLLQSGKTPEEIAEEERQARLLEEQMAAEAAAAEAERQALANDPLAPLPETEGLLERPVAKPQEEQPFEVRGDDDQQIVPDQPIPEEMEQDFLERNKRSPVAFEVRDDAGETVVAPVAKPTVDIDAAMDVMQRNAPAALGQFEKRGQALTRDLPKIAKENSAYQKAVAEQARQEEVVDPANIDAVSALRRRFDSQVLGYIASNWDQHKGNSADIMRFANELSKERYGGQYGIDPKSLAASMQAVKKDRRALALVRFSEGSDLTKEEREQAVEEIRAATEDGKVNVQKLRQPYTDQPVPALFRQLEAGLGESVGGMAAAAPQAIGVIGSVLTRDPTTAKRVVAAMPEFMKDVQAWGERHGAGASEAFAQGDPGYAEGTAKRDLYDMTRSLVELGDAYASTVAGGGGGAAVKFGQSLVGARVFGSQINDSLDRGRTPGEAYADAVAMSAFEFIPEGMVLKQLLGNTGSKVMNTLKSAGAEAIQEDVTELLSMGYQAGMFGDDITVHEALKRLGNAGLLGAGAGAGVSTISGTAQSAAESQTLQATRKAISDWANNRYAAKQMQRMEPFAAGKPASQVATERLSPGRPAGEIIARPTDIKRNKVDATPTVLTKAERTQQARPRLVRPTPTPVDTNGEVEVFTLPKGTVTSKPGPRRSFRTRNGAMASSNHGGYDIAKKLNAAVEAAASGVVVSAKPRGGYGNQVVIRHSDGTTSSYSHLNNFKVKEGQQVKQGQSVGGAGQTGNATGVHVHFELKDRNGARLNPLNKKVATLRQDPETNEFVDDDGFEVDPTPVDYGEEDLAAQQAEEDAVFTEATGQQWDDDDFGMTEAAEEEAPAIARGVEEEAAAETPAVRRGAATQAFDEDDGSGPASIQRGAEASLDAAQAANPARAALAEETAVEAPPAEGPLPLAEEGAADYTQPQPNEETIFATDEQGNLTDQVARFRDTETGYVREVGEPPEGAAVSPTAAVPPSPETAPPAAAIDETAAAAQDMAARETEALAKLGITPAPEVHEGLTIPEREAIAEQLPVSGKQATTANREARIQGQAVALGLTNAPPLSSLSKGQRTAFNIGLVEGRKAVATAKKAKFVSAAPSVGASPTTQAKPVSSKAAPKGKKMAALETRRQRNEKVARAEAEAKAEQRQKGYTATVTLGTTPGDVHTAKDLPAMPEGMKKGIADADKRSAADQENMLDAIGRGIILDGDMITTSFPRWAVERGYADIGPTENGRMGRLTEKGKAKLAELRKEQAQPETKQTKPAPTTKRPTKKPVGAAKPEKQAEPSVTDAEAKAAKDKLPDNIMRAITERAYNEADAKYGAKPTGMDKLAHGKMVARLVDERAVAMAKKQAKFEAETAPVDLGPEEPAPKPVAKRPAPPKPSPVTAATKARIAEIEKQAERIDEKFFDLENDGTKSSLRAYLKGLVKKGIIEQADIDGIDYMFKDKDMGVEDVTSEIRFAVEQWKDTEIAALAGPTSKKRVATGKATGATPTYTDPFGRQFFYGIPSQVLDQSATLTGQNPNSMFMFVAGGSYAQGTTGQEADQAGVQEGTAAGEAGADRGGKTAKGRKGEQLEFFPGMDLGLARLPDTIEVDGVERPAYNADNEPIASSVESVENFWRWFGDSEMVDDKGRPKLFYHGTRSEFDEFDTWKGTYFFSDNPAVSETYTRNVPAGAGKVLPVYLRVLDPVHYDAEGRSWTEVVHDEGENSDEDIEEAYNRFIMDELDNHSPQADRYLTVEREDGKFDVVNPRHHWQASSVEDEVLATFDTEDEAQDYIGEVASEQTSEYMDNLDTSEWVLISQGYLEPATTVLSTDDVAEMASGSNDAVWIDDVVDTGTGDDIASTVIIILNSGATNIKSATENVGTFNPESRKFKQRRTGEPAIARGHEIKDYPNAPPYDPGKVKTFGTVTSKVEAAVRQVLKSMGVEGREDLAIQIMSKATARDLVGLEDAGEFTETDGERIIRIVSLSNFDSAQTARHEVIHYMRDTGIINPQEWRILAAWARSNPSLMAWATSNYPLGKDMTRDGQVEEAVAEGFARWKNGDPVLVTAGGVKGIFDYLLQAIQKLGIYLGMGGITRAQLNDAVRLMNDIKSGEQVRKFDAKQVPAKAKPAFGRKPIDVTVSSAVVRGEISVAEAHFIRTMAMSGVAKAQAVWHGSRVNGIKAFLNSFINTGEQAQAFGWGLYFAQKKGVADWYRIKNTMDTSRPAQQIVNINDQPMIEWVADKFNAGRAVANTSDWGVAAYEVATLIHNYVTTGGREYNGWLDTLHVAYDKEMVGALADADQVNDLAAREKTIAAQKRVAQIFGGLRMKNVAFDFGPTSGSLYKAEIPDNHLMLDLDQKLSVQPAVVTAALTKVRDHLASVGLLPKYQKKYGDFWNWSGHTLQMKVLPRDLLNDNGFPTEVVDPELADAINDDEGPKAGSLWLRELGVPGNRYLDRDSRDPSQTTKTHNYVVFDDTEIEVLGEEVKVDVGRSVRKRRVSRPKTGRGIGKAIHDIPMNGPLDDPTNPSPGVMGKLHDQVMGMLGATIGENVDTADGIADLFKRKFVNKYHQINKAQARAARALGVERLPEQINPMAMIVADERGYKMEHLMDNQVKPMIAEMHAAGISMADLGLYLYARHAPARNKRVARENPEFRKSGKPGSGMSDADAAQIMADFAADGRINDLQGIAVHIDRMIEAAQQERLSSGLLTQDAIDKGFKPQDKYVPLRGNKNIEPEMEMMFPTAVKKGGGFSVAGSEGHPMYGRESMAELESIVGYTISQAMEAIDRGYRNKVAKSMHDLFRAVPDSNFVQIDRVKRVATWNSKTGQVEYQMQTRMNDPAEQLRTIFFKDGDTIHKMTFNDRNPSAMRFVKAAKNLDPVTLNRVVQLVSFVTRLWTKANTQWSVDFILANAVKDVQIGVVNASSLDQKGLRRAIIKNVASMGALRGSAKGAFGRAGAGFASADVWYQTYAEFEANGGKLSYAQASQLEDVMGQIETEFANAKRSNWNPRKAGGRVLEFIDNLNGSVENMTRLAAYKALRDGGIEPKQAAEAVRELTTNFQQHGEWGPLINSFYGFANASIVGSARFVQTLAKNPLMLVGLASAGALQDMLNTFLDQEDWDDKSEEDKDGHFFLMTPDFVPFNIKIPAGYGINAFITMGRKTSEWLRGKKNKDGVAITKLEAAIDVGMSAVNAFAPISGRTWLNLVAPSVFDPFADVTVNKNYWGTPIYKESFDKTAPESHNAREKTAEIWKTIAEGINGMTGGNRVIQGGIDLPPEAIGHVVKEELGGVGKTAFRLADLADKISHGEPTTPNDYPVVRRFAAPQYGGKALPEDQINQFNDRYYDAKTTVDQAKNLVKNYGLKSPEYRKFYEDNKPVINAAESITLAKKRLDKLSGAVNALERGQEYADGATKEDRAKIFKVTKIPVRQTGKPMTEEEVAKQRKVIDDKKLALAKEFDEMWRRKVMGAKPKSLAPTSP